MRELGRPNRAERVAWALTLFGLPCAGVGWWLSVSWKSEHGLSVFLGGFLAAMCSPLLALTMRSRRRAAANVLAGVDLLARWRCDAGAFARHRVRTGPIWALSGAVVALSCVFLWTGLDPVFLTAIIGLPALAVFMIRALLSQRLTWLADEVWIARNAMLVDGHLVSWTGLTRLDSVSWDRRKNSASLLFALSVSSRSGRERFEVRAPVPPTAEAAARRVARLLQSRCWHP